MTGLARPFNLSQVCLHYNMQDRVGEWGDMVFGTPQHTPYLAHVRRINQEVQELLDELDFEPTQSVETVKSNPELKMRIAKELADIYITICRAAWVLGVDLESEADAKQSVNERRRWRAHGDGTGQHIKE